MRVKILTLLAALLFAGPALGFGYSDCSGNTSGELYTVSRYSLTCIAALPADSTDDTAAIHIRAKQARICFDPHIDGVGVTAARVNIHHCSNGKMPSATPENECPDITGPLSAVEGAAQTACFTITAGTYYFEMSVAIAAGDIGRITVQGLGD